MSAIDAPICRLCHKQHGTREPHIFEGGQKTQPPATSGNTADKNRQGRAAKPSPGKRKPRTKIIATFAPAKAKKK